MRSVRRATSPIYGLLALPFLAAACDAESSQSPQIAAEASAPAPTVQAPPATPEPPRAPVIVVEDASCTIDGEIVLFSAADASDRIAAILAGKPHVQGELVALSASRDAKTPRVSAVLSALKKVKAKGALVRTKKRDSSMGELELAIDHAAPADCTATGAVNKDGSIAVWPSSGGVAKRFKRGFAGPDLTLGSDALQKLAAGCDSSVWYVAGDDALVWGLPFDLALATLGAPDAKAMRASHTVLLTSPPVAGRKVSE